MAPGILGLYSVFISIQLCRWWRPWFGELAQRSKGSHGQQSDAHRIVGSTSNTCLAHQSVTDGCLCQCLRGQDRERERAAAQPQLKGEGSEAGPSPLSSEPFALLAPLGEALLVLTFPFLPFLEGPFAGVIHQLICCSLARGVHAATGRKNCRAPHPEGPYPETDTVVSGATPDRSGSSGSPRRPRANLRAPSSRG